MLLRKPKFSSPGALLLFIHRNVEHRYAHRIALRMRVRHARTLTCHSLYGRFITDLPNCLLAQFGQLSPAEF